MSGVHSLNVAKPDTILAWHRKLVARKFDGSSQRKARGRPLVDKELNVRIAPAPAHDSESGRVVRRDRLGGLLRYYYRDAA
jgi:hypothetical protein